MNHSLSLTSPSLHLDTHYTLGSMIPRPSGSAPRTEEQIPYHPLIPIDVSFLLNYNLTVTRVTAIDSSPTLLESTSLVFVSGLDLFFTQAAPSKRFDVLSEDFNRPMLLLSVGALVLGTWIASRRSAKITLHASWS